MKKFILILVIINSVIIYSQNTEPIQRSFLEYDTNKTLRFNANDSNYIQKRFLKGWHWDSRQALSKALLMNQVDIYCDHNWDTIPIPPNTMLVIKPGNFSHAIEASRLNARSILYSPVLKIDSTKPDSLVIRDGDTTNNIFGFKHIFGNISTNSNDPNFYRLVIDSISKYQNQVILSDPWPDNQFFMHGYKLKADEDWMNDDFLCRQMFFTINLRRYGSDNSVGGDTVLEIELPYTYKFSPTHDTVIDMKFGRLPKEGFNPNNDTTYNGRTDLFRETDSCYSIKRKIIITKDMIPRNNKDITIRAKFVMDGDVYNDNSNKRLKIHPSKEFNTIDKINIKVKYKGSLPIQINYVRLNTQNGEQLLRGDHDDSLIVDIQRIATRFTSDDFKAKSPGSKIFRFNTIVEGSVFNWQAERYFNKLIGNIGTCEVGPYYALHYERYVNPPDKWYGLFVVPAGTGTPYSYKNYDYSADNLKIRTANIYSGYMGMINGIRETDPLKCHYEDYLYVNNNTYPINYFRSSFDSSFYELAVDRDENCGQYSWLKATETYTYNNFIKNYSYSSLYSNRNWWGQLFTCIALETVENSKHYFVSRPWTGEEFNYSAIMPIITGAKGILYDGYGNANGLTTKYQFYDGNCFSDSVRNIFENKSAWELILADSSGSDFIRDGNEINRLDTLIYNLDTLSNFYNRPKDKLYFGRKSLRIETRKLHDWIEINNDTLMQLKLRSYYAHGYKIWENFHPKYTTNPLRNIVNLESVTSRRLFKYGISNPKDSIEPSDSSFFDLSLLSASFDSNMTNKFFIGFANRRTNPLIFTPSYNTFYGGQFHLDFYSTAEFDEFVSKDSSKNLYGVMLPKSYWKSQFWKRLACRELSIQFSGVKPQNPLMEIFPYYYKIQELGVGTSYFTDTAKYYWVQKPYYHIIDTTVMKYGALKSRLLPGQGKIVAVTDRNICDDICPPMPNHTCEELLRNVVFNVVRDPYIWGDSCKYDLSIIILQGWQYDSTDIRTIIRTDNSPAYLTFDSDYNYNINQQDSTAIVRLDSIPVNQEIRFGSFYTTCPEHFTIKFQVGKRIMEIFPGCTYEGNFEGNCDCGYQMRSSTNCCDNIELYSAETTENGQLSGKFNVNIKQNNTDCAICEVSLVRKNGTKVLAKLSKEKNEKKLQIPNFTNIGKISMDKSNGRTKDTINAYIKDKDGKLICKKEVILETLDWKQEKSIEYDEEPTESNTTDLTLQYFPNPVEEMLNIEIKSDICKKVKVRITNLESIEIFSKELKTNNLTQISTEEIPNGVYFLKIEDCESDKYIIRKIVIRK